MNDVVRYLARLFYVFTLRVCPSWSEREALGAAVELGTRAYLECDDVVDAKRWIQHSLADNPLWEPDGTSRERARVLFELAPALAVARFRALVLQFGSPTSENRSHLVESFPE